LNPVWRLDILPVAWFNFFGNMMFLLFAVRTISIVIVDVAQSDNARSTYICDERVDNEKIRLPTAAIDSARAP
jgi:hypothetical protein